MKITNIHGLPESLVRLAENDTYSKGDADISVTTLIDSPQIRVMSEIYGEHFETDVSDMVLAMMGHSMHHLLDQHCDEDSIPELRLSAEFGGKVLSGQIDRMEKDGDGYAIRDYKVTSAYKVLVNKGADPSWTKQVNCYAHLARVAGYKVTNAGAIVFIRDWKKSSVNKDPNFPKAPIIKVDIPLWSHEAAQAYIEGRIRLHFGEELPKCTPEERWQGDDVFAVHEYGAGGTLKKRASRLLPSHEEAEAYITNRRLAAEVIERPGRPVRCIDGYCPVSEYCVQFKNEEW